MYKENIMSEAVEAAESVVESTETLGEEAAVEAVEEAIVESTEGESSEGVQAETVEELQEEVAEAIEDGATEEEVKQMVKEFELKVNGKTFNKKLDLSDEEAVKKELQMAAAGRQAMQEAAELKKMYADELDRLRDPSKALSVLAELGLNPDELAEMHLQQRIEEMKKSPEQLEREKMQVELEEARKKLQEQEEAAREAEIARLNQEAAIQLDEEISSAIEAHSDLPNTPRVVKQIADTMLWAMENGYDDVKAEDVLPTVKAEIKKEIAELMDQLPEEMMESFIGQKNLERMRKKRLNSMKKTESAANLKQPVASEAVKKEEPRKKVNLSDFLRSR